MGGAQGGWRKGEGGGSLKKYTFIARAAEGWSGKKTNAKTKK